MANFYNYSASSSTHGRFLQRVVSSISDGDHWFKELMAMMAQMLDGDGSQDAHFATITTRFGFPDTATAHAAYSELLSCYSKTSGDGSVSSVRAARDQFVARFTT